MEVVAFDPALAGGQSPVDGVRLMPSLDAMLPLVDVLSLHVPLNKHTRNMLGAAQFAAMRRGAILVNTARGEVIDEPALIAALQSGQLHAAGLDTMATEPLPAGSPLAALPNVVLTPHVGGSTPGCARGHGERRRAQRARLASGQAGRSVRLRQPPGLFLIHITYVSGDFP